MEEKNLALMCRWVLGEKTWSKNVLNYINNKTNRISKNRECGKIKGKFAWNINVYKNEMKATGYTKINWKHIILDT